MKADVRSIDFTLLYYLKHWWDELWYQFFFTRNVPNIICCWFHMIIRIKCETFNSTSITKWHLKMLESAAVFFYDIHIKSNIVE